MEAWETMALNMTSNRCCKGKKEALVVIKLSLEGLYTPQMIALAPHKEWASKS